MNTTDKISQFLKICDVKSVDELTDEQIVYLYADIKPERGEHNVIDVFAERSGDDAHSFANVVRQCINSERIVVVNAIMNEGEMSEKSEMNQYRFTYTIV